MTLPKPGTLCTGDTPSAPQGRYSFSAPSDTWVQEIIYGLFANYNDPGSWWQCGTMTPDEAAELFTQIAQTVGLVTYVGTIIAVGGLAGPPNTLPCDGTSYLRADYPDLFNAIGPIWGSVDSDHFNVPDLRGRVLVGLGTGPGLSPRTLGDTGGEETHTLSTGEMPSHTHTTMEALASFTSISPGVPEPMALPSPNVTGFTGGGGSHNNMQPFAVINYVIIAK